MPHSLAIPEPRSTTLEQIPVLVAQIERFVAQCDDVAALAEAETQIAALEVYLRGKAELAELQRAHRRLETRIGDLAPPQPVGRKPADEMVRARDHSPIPKQRLSEFRQMAEWQNHPDITALIEKGAPRRQILRRIAELKPVDVTERAPITGDRWEVRLGDFRDTLADIPDESVDLIVTDPPYPKDDLPLFSDLSKFASRVLTPRGVLFCWTGQLFLPDVLNSLGENLNYGWTFCLHMPGQSSRIMGRHMIQAWKPVVAFTPGTWPSGEWADDFLVSTKATKGDYDWQQNPDPAQRLIRRYSSPDAVILDPFTGVGSFGAAALAAGRRFIGCELDPTRHTKAADRLKAADHG